MPKSCLPVRGVLIHVTHYDPRWCPRKKTERPFDADVALEVIEAMSRHGMNLLAVDCGDGVRYASHPELQRHYSAPMTRLGAVAAAAREHGIEIVPKLNFSKSPRHQHDQWLRSHSGLARRVVDDEEYWRTAADVIAELVSACRPERFFHVGMDEDHSRSLVQYVGAIRRLRKIVRSHRLRTVIWNDSCHDRKDSGAQVHAEKSRAAEPLLPKDVVQVLWDYGRVHPAAVRRLVGGGFETWVAPGRTPGLVRRWRRAAAAGGAGGMLMTLWIKCSKANRRQLLDLINAVGPEYR